MSQIDGIAGSSSVSFSQVTGARSPQMALAMLMLELADTNKKAAMDGIHDIETEQAKKKEMADMMNLAREYKQNGLHENTKGIPDGIEPKLKDFLKNNGISIPGGKEIEGNYDKVSAAWDRVIAQLQTKMDNTGADIQTKMVQLQDLMGQYNSYTSGANTAIAKSNDILSSLARGQ